MLLMQGGENYSDVPLDDNSPGALEEYEELKKHGDALFEQWAKEDEEAAKQA